MVRAGTPYAAGIPCHGIWQFLDSLYDYQDRVKIIQVMHEQSAVHLADGHYRAGGLLRFPYRESESGIEEIQVKNLVTAAQGDVHSLSFPTGQFDFV